MKQQSRYLLMILGVLNWSGSSSLGLSWSHSCGCSHLELEGSEWPHSHDWQLELAPGWASLSMSLALRKASLFSPDVLRTARGHEWKLQGLGYRTHTISLLGNSVGQSKSRGLVRFAGPEGLLNKRRSEVNSQRTCTAMGRILWPSL